MSRNDRKIVWRGQFLTTLTRTSEVCGPVEQVKAEMQRPMNTTAKPRESEQLPLFNTFERVVDSWVVVLQQCCTDVITDVGF